MMSPRFPQDFKTLENTYLRFEKQFAEQSQNAIAASNLPCLSELPSLLCASLVTLDQIREYCLKKKGRITEGLPFGEGVLVFKVNGKMFLLANMNEHPLSVNLKCHPEHAVELRERYESVQPGYHMNKKYWNTVTLDGNISTKEIFEMIDHSYEQVVKGMSKAVRKKLLSK